MGADLFCNILETTLFPFVREKLPNHWFMQDNDPKHMSRRAKAFSKKKISTGGIPPWKVQISTQ